VAGRPVHTFEVLRTEQLTPHITRVVLGGSGFDTFTPNDFTDAYVKIVFVRDGVDVASLPQPLTLDSFNELPVEQRPTVRTYTVRSVDTERRELAIDFVLHGQHGVAGPWANGGDPWPTGLPDGSQRCLRAGPCGGLASAGR
jgi:NADPH-dependent ferric siderophore reductase